MVNVVMLGAGGHARVLVASLRETGKAIVGCVALEAPTTPWPAGIPYLGTTAALAELDPAETMLVNAIGSTGPITARANAFEQAKAGGFMFLSVVHIAALLLGDVELDEGVQIMAGAVVQNGARIGRNALINTGAIIDHDCRIGAHSHVATGAALSGGVVVGTGVHVGTGASLIQGVRVGDGVIVGAGAVVLRDVPAGETVFGVPARSLA